MRGQQLFFGIDGENVTRNPTAGAQDESESCNVGKKGIILKPAKVLLIVGLFTFLQISECADSGFYTL